MKLSLVFFQSLHGSPRHRVRYVNRFEIQNLECLKITSKVRFPRIGTNIASQQTDVGERERGRQYCFHARRNAPPPDAVAFERGTLS